MPIEGHALDGTTSGKGAGGLWQVVCEKLVCPCTHDEQRDKHATCLLDGGAFIGSTVAAFHLREEREPTSHHRSPVRRVEQNVLVRARAGKQGDRGNGAVSREGRLECALSNPKLARTERSLAQLLRVGSGYKPIRGASEV